MTPVYSGQRGGRTRRRTDREGDNGQRGKRMDGEGGRTVRWADKETDKQGDGQREADGWTARGRTDRNRINRTEKEAVGQTWRRRLTKRVQYTVYTDRSGYNTQERHEC